MNDGKTGGDSSAVILYTYGRVCAYTLGEGGGQGGKPEEPFIESNNTHTSCDTPRSSEIQYSGSKNLLEIVNMPDEIPSVRSGQRRDFGFPRVRRARDGGRGRGKNGVEAACSPVHTGRTLREINQKMPRVSSYRREAIVGDQRIIVIGPVTGEGSGGWREREQEAIRQRSGGSSSDAISSSRSVAKKYHNTDHESGHALCTRCSGIQAQGGRREREGRETRNALPREEILSR